MDLQDSADMVTLQGLWSPEKRAKMIVFREMRALRRVVESLPDPGGMERGSEKSDSLEELRDSPPAQRKFWQEERFGGRSEHPREV